MYAHSSEYSTYGNLLLLYNLSMKYEIDFQILLVEKLFQRSIKNIYNFQVEL